MNSFKKGEGVPLLNFEGGPGVLVLNFEDVPGPGSQGPEVPGPGILVPLLHHAIWELVSCLDIARCRQY